MDSSQAAPETTGAPAQVRGPASGGNPLASQSGDRAPAAQLPPEQDLWSGRMHWQNAFGRVVLWLLLNVGLTIGSFYAPNFDWLTRTRWVLITLGFFLVSAIVMLGGAAVRILQTRYRLSSQRLFIERGILSRTMDQTELIRVDDVRMQQSLWNRIFNIGTVMLMSTDATDRSVTIIGIKDPVRVTELIRQQMRTLRGKTLFIENL